MDILYPAFVLFALTVLVQLRLGMKRIAAVRDGSVDPKFYRAHQGDGEPEGLRIYSRHLINLYESPVLFYAIIIIASISEQAGTVPLLLAWLYVLLRIMHSYVHLGSNKVLLRFRLFLASVIVLTALWAVVLIGMLLR